MQRRDFVSTVGLTAMGLLASQMAAAATATAPKRRVMSKELKDVLDSTSDCLKTGDVCLAHCHSLLAAGDTSLADCQKTVMNMLAVCDGLSKLAAYNNCDEADLKSYAKVCGQFCKTCESACEKHAGHHAECKACYDSCKTCAKACESYAA
jgi:Cys-rich four helix bundle protein (predicted Tat secretion target)